MNPATLTGAEVRRIREAQRPRISRRAFAAMIGCTPTRVYNIEERDSWKPGDREAVARVLAGLQTPGGPDAGGAVPGDPTGPSGETPPASLDLLAEEEDETERLVELAAGPPYDGDVDRLRRDLAALGEFERTHEATDDHLYGRCACPRPVDLTATEVTEDEPVFEVGADGEPVTLLDPATFVSNSQVQAFDRCRRKWWLGWFRGLHLKSKDPTGHRSVGDRVHRALAAYYVPDGQRPVDPREALERILVDDWTAYVATLDGREPDEQVARDFTSEATLQRAMVAGYVDWLAQTGEDENLIVIGSEQVRTAEVVIETTGRTRTLLGRLDVRVRRATDGALLFMDHKTVPDLTGPARTLHMDPQMLLYHIIEWLSTGGEERCDGALYNMLRKTKRTVRANPPFFARLEVRHNVHELESELLQVIAKMEDIDAARDMLAAGVDHRIAVPRSARSDCSWSCDFFPVCPMFDDGSRAEDMLAQWYEEGDPLRYYEPRLLT